MGYESFIEVGNQLKTELVGAKASGSGQRWRCPPELRLKAVEYAHSRREAGATLSEIAGELGIGESTLGKWLYRKAPSTGNFRSVAIVARSEDEREPDGDDRFHLVSPKGYEVSGLNVRSLAYLLRVVG